MSARSGLLVAGLSLAIPAGLFTGMVMAEPYAYPAFLFAILLAVRAVERRTTATFVWTALAAVALVVIGGLQFGLFLPAVLAAALTVLPRHRRVTTVAGLLVFAVASALSVRFADQGVVAEVVGKARLLHQPIGQTAAWLGINAFLLAVAAGWVTAPGAVLGLADLIRSSHQDERFLGVISVLLLGGLLFEAATWSATFDRTYERFAFYGVPLILIGFVRWMERAAGRSPTFAMLGYACAAGAAVVPLAAGMHVDNPYAPPLTGLAFTDPASTAVVWAPLLAVTAIATGLVGYRHRRGLAVVAAAVALSSTAVAAAAVIRFAHSLPTTRTAVGAHAAYVTTSNEDAFAEMRTLFWNPNLDRVVVFGSGGAPDGFGGANAMLRPDGSLVTVAGTVIPGPFVASPNLLAVPSSSPAPLAVFAAPVDVLAFGWSGVDDYLAPFVRIVIAGRNRGANVQLRLRSDDGQKTMALRCPGRAQRFALGERATTILIHAPAHRVRTCDLRLIAGTGHRASWPQRRGPWDPFLAGRALIDASSVGLG